VSDYISADSLALIAHKSGVTQGRAKERAKIVAWLRGLNDWQEDCIADEIEAEEHLK
jgi:hypothetical protein